MTVIESLSKEHALFHKIIARIDATLNLDEAAARLELKRALLVLLPALDRHEAIESRVFMRPPRGGDAEAARLAATISGQEKDIRRLHRDILDILRETGEYDFPRLKSLASELCQKLREHFYMEESRLWPHQKESVPAGQGRAVERQAGRNVADLEREISRNWDLVADYVKSP
jgi:hypothetical protein